MVFQTAVLLIRNRGPDEFWRKRKIFKLAAHFWGRKRNCYSIAIRYVHRALAYATMSRKLKKIDMRNLWITRVSAGCEEHGLPFNYFQKGLIRSDILLSQKTLSELAVWEPRTFKALTQLAWTKGVEDGLNGFRDIDKLGKSPENVITRGMLKKEIKDS
ncbi:mitochondrial ribosomal protein L20 [Lycorma delicatula]|uniref:mitochondrial ribosomal protein L20 n=1 Tax=Lycorma delicatula TaxID=130591 RepID=UPI003F50DB0F